MADAARSFSFSIYGGDIHQARVRTIGQSIGSALLAAMKREMLRVADYVRAEKLSGQVLNRRSGDLSRSITGQASLEGMKVIGEVGTKGVPYAGVHEFGGTYEIPATSRMITQVFGRPVFPHPILVRPHTATYPVRSYIRTSADENRDKVQAALQAAARQAFSAA